MAVKYIAPATDSKCTLLAVPVAYIPFFRRFFEEMQREYIWQTRDDWFRAYQIFAEIEVGLMSNCITDLIESNNRIYRLLDSALNGTQYSSIENPLDPDAPIINPAIPDAPPGAVGDAPGLRRQLLDAQGVIGAGWFGIGGQPATMADLVRALRIGSDDDTTRITDAIDSIASDSLLAEGSQAANILSVVRGLFGDVADVTAEGAILGTLIAASVATSGMLGVLSGQIDRLIASLDGGLDAPADNVLLAIRGTTAAGETRNVIDSSAGSNGTVLSSIDSRLETIANNTGDTVSRLDFLNQMTSDNDALLVSLLTEVRDYLV